MESRKYHGLTGVLEMLVHLNIDDLLNPDKKRNDVDSQAEAGRHP